MRQFFLAMVLLATMLSLFSLSAQARLKPRPVHPAASQSSSAAIEETPPPVPEKSWKTTIGAWVIALGAGELAARLGMEPAILGVAVAGLVVVLLVLGWLLVRWLLQRNRQGKAVYAGDYHNSIVPGHKARSDSRPSVKTVTRPARVRSRANVPPDFDVQKFSRSANAIFLRLQMAWDRGDMGDIREFTHDDIALEFKKQIRRRDEGHYRTTVEKLKVDLLKLETVGKEHIATVKFGGMIAEEDNPARKFLEVWKLSKPKTSGDGWTVILIQQFS